MAARSSLFGSVVASILHGGGCDSSSLLGGGAHRSWPVVFLTPPAAPPPTSNDSIGGLQQRRWDRSVVGMPSAAALGSVATTQSALHSNLINGSSSSSTPTTTKQLALPTALAKARAGVTFFRTVIYMCVWVMPRLERLDRKLKAQKKLMFDCLTQATEAAELIFADGNAPIDVSSVQSSGRIGKQQPDGMTGNRTSVDKLEEAKEKETPTGYLQAEIAELDDLKAKISRLKLKSRSKH